MLKNDESVFEKSTIMKDNVEKSVESKVSAIIKAAEDKINDKTPVMILHEVTTKIGQVPSYDIVESSINPIIFTCTVSCIGKKAVGTGKSKKDAKQAAAKSLIEQLYGETVKEIPLKKSDHISQDHDVKRLQLMCKKHELEQPQYVVGQKSNSPTGEIHHYQCVIGDFVTKGEGQTMNLAMQDAARKMIEELNDVFITCVSNKASIVHDTGTPAKRFATSEKVMTPSDFQSNTLNEFSYSASQLDSKQTAFLRYISQLSKDLQKDLHKNEINISKNSIMMLRKELQKFLKSTNISYYHTVIKSSEPEPVFTFIIQLNTFELSEMSLGKTEDEAELRAMNKIIEALRKKFRINV